MAAMMLSSSAVLGGVRLPAVRARASAKPAAMKAVKASMKAPVTAALKQETAQLAMASAMLTTLAAAPAAEAAELMQLADGRPLLFLGLFAPVLGWVAFNIGAPFFRQLDAMQGNAPPAKGKAAAKKRAIVAGLTGLTAAALLAAPESADAAQELAQLADGRPLLFLGLFAPVLGWVAFNIGAPFFRQLDAMQGNAPPAKGKAAAKKRAAVAGLAGLSASALLAAPEAAQAAELMQLADGRPLLFLGLFAPVLGWVAFNIGAPFFRQLDAMQGNAPAAKGKAAPKKR